MEGVTSREFNSLHFSISKPIYHLYVPSYPPKGSVLDKILPTAELILRVVTDHNRVETMWVGY